MRKTIWPGLPVVLVSILAAVALLTLSPISVAKVVPVNEMISNTASVEYPLRPQRGWVGRWYPEHDFTHWEAAPMKVEHMQCLDNEHRQVVCYLYPEKLKLNKGDGMSWKNRIVGLGEEEPTQLIHNPFNWRVHTEQQRNGIVGSLSGVGWVDGIIVNKRTGHIIDGHARAEEAAKAGQETIPVIYVDVSENEELLVLATFDPLGAMAVTDQPILEQLLHDVSTDNADLMQLLEDIAVEHGVVPKEGAESNDGEPGDGDDAKHPVVAVLCDSEKGRLYVADELAKQGYDVRLAEVKEKDLKSGTG